MIHTITSQEDFYHTIKTSRNVVVDFNATWCGPCKNIAPKIEELSRDYHMITFLSVDVDNLSDVAENFKVSAMPTFVFIRDGNVINTVVGANYNAVLVGTRQLSGLFE